jgi:DNA-binding MarR family transcriptional regulator
MNEENMQDCKAKGRQTRGERSAQAKLTENEALEIQATYYHTRQGRRGGYSNAAELAAKFGVTRGTIVQIAKGELWGHLKQPHGDNPHG